MKSPSRFARRAPAALLPLTLIAFALPAEARPPVPMAHPAPGARLKWDSKKFMRVSELRPGMKGYALTVFRGTKIEKFNIEILGVMAKFNEGKDYILFRALDGPSVTRSLGIAHGMSGSPIYINGRLIGAISMGIPGTQFAREPIALATPIEDMLEAWSPDLPQKPSDISASAPTAASALSALGVTDTRFQPIGMPLMVSGLGTHSLSRLRDMMAPYHFDVMAGGGGALSADSLGTNPLAQGATLQPGSAVGVSLVQGDVDYTATGTVTYRDGKRLLLFGHPFTSLGPIDAALTTAYVVSIFPSYQDSVKLGSPIKTVGRIFQDRPFSVGGVIGPMPQMVPMTVSVNDLSTKRRKDFHVRIINHPLLTAQFVSQVGGAAIEQVHGQPGDSMATVSIDVDAEEIGHIKRTNTFYDATAIDQSATGDLDSLMRLLSSNPFYPIAVKSVKMNVTIQNKHDTAEIDHLFLTQSKFAPGDTVTVGVVLKPYKRPLYTRLVPIKIPMNTADGTLTLNVQGGGTAGGGGITSLLGGLLQIRASEPTGSAVNVAQLVKKFGEKPQNNQLVTRLLLPTSALSIKGEKLTDLPPNLAAAMQSSRTTGLKTERDEVKETETLPYVTSGSQSLSITVRRRDLTEAPAPLSPASPSVTTLPPPTSASDAPAPSPLSNSGGDDGDDSDDAARLLSPSGFVLYHRRPLTLAATPAKPADPKPAAAPPGPDAVPAAIKPAVVKPVGRLASVWHQGTQADFAAGNLTNVAVTSTGDVRLAPSLRKLADTAQNYVWAILPDGHGNLYLGTGDNGEILKMDAAGKVTSYYKTGELEVTSLALGGNGTLYAGTAPHGAVFQITPQGKGDKVFSAPEKYVTALTVANAGTDLYATTGGGTGRVYEMRLTSLPAGLTAGGIDGPQFVYLSKPVAPTGALFTSPEAHLLSLATDKGGNVYAGSSPSGIVYKITPDGKSTVLYDAAEPNITALTTDKDGNVYAGTGPTGTVYRISPDGAAKRVLGKLSTGITGLQADADGAVYAAAGGTVTKINADDTTQSFVAPQDQQFVSLALDPADGAVYTGTGVVGSVYGIGAFRQTAGQTNTLEGNYQSVVHDAGIRAKWGTLTWGGDAGVRLQTRSGDVPRPDASWSAWSTPLNVPTGQTVASPPARYIQYQALLTGGSGTVAPRLRDVTLYYLPRNQAPTVAIRKPADGDAVSKDMLIQWTASDPDKDTLAYDVAYSKDGGQTWTPIKKRASATKTTTRTVAAMPVSPTVIIAQGTTNLDKVQNLPPAVRAQILAQMKAEQLKAAATPAIAAKPADKGAVELKDTSFSWDTTEVPDGTYQVRVIASDKPSNPADFLTARAVSAPFLIANAAPTLTVQVTPLALHGTVTTGPAFVKAVQAKIDGGDPVAASADDGLFDSPSEAWSLTLPPLPVGKHSVEVQAVDTAGNTVTKTVEVTSAGPGG